MEYLGEDTPLSLIEYQINAIHSRRQRDYCVSDKGWVAINWRAEAALIQLAATQSTLRNHPEVNDLAEPANLRSLEQAINIKR